MFLLFHPRTCPSHMQSGSRQFWFCHALLLTTHHALKAAYPIALTHLPHTDSRCPHPILNLNVCHTQTPNTPTDISKYLTLVGIVAAFVSSLFAHGFLTLSRKIQNGELRRRCALHAHALPAGLMTAARRHVS